MVEFKLDQPQCLHAHLQFLMSLIDLRREINVKIKLINFLQFLIFSMMWSSLTYQNCTPYLTIILGILTMITLTWVAVCQQNHINELGKSITLLCVESPFNDEEQSDRLSESGQHWD